LEVKSKTGITLSMGCGNKTIEVVVTWPASRKFSVLPFASQYPFSLLPFTVGNMGAFQAR
jgi:hypothetical protein